MKNINKSVMLICMCFAAYITAAQSFPGNIPTNHPRIWWNSERLTLAQQWLSTHPLNPSTSTNPVESSSDPKGNALKYILTGNTANARVAINWALNAIATMPTTGLTCDQCRWYGEEAVIAFDWCYDQMTAAERSTFTSKMNNVVAAFNIAPWGNDNPESNYFWGYHRLSLLWGIASYWENTPQATNFINNALQTKWDNLFIPHAATKASGGIPAEGVDYGGTLESYPVIALETMRMYGRDMYAETEYFKKAVFANIYSTLPDFTYDNPLRNNPGKSWFPYGDAGDFLGAADPVLRSSVKDFMKYAAIRWHAIKLGKYARRWITWLNVNSPKLYDAADPGGAEENFSNLPLDYYSTGIVGHAFTRTQWGPQATVAHLQLASPPLIGHEHFDTGNWQIWRNQRWLSRESPGRGQGSGYKISGYKNSTDSVFSEESLNHNILLFGGKGHAKTGNLGKDVAPAHVLRMETTPDYFYTVVDVTPSYINTDDNLKWGNENIAHAEREFLFIRPLETLFIFDRVESVPTANTTKTFITHFQTLPAADGTPQTYLSVNGNQALRLQTLLPANLAPANYRYFEESSKLKLAETGHTYRLEVETVGTGPQYFMHVAQARDVSEQNINSTLTDNGSYYTVTLVHPTRGTAKIIVNKGITSSGGSFGFSTTGVPASTLALATGVQAINVTDNGPVWSGVTTCNYSISPNNISLPATLSTDSINVNTGTTCSWSASSNVPWLTVTNAASSSGNGTVRYAVAPNTGAARTGVINIADKTFTVNQAAVAADGSILDYYINEAEPVISFSTQTGGTGTAVVTTEGLEGSNCLKFSDLTIWDKTKRIHHVNAKDISSVLSTDILRISVDMTPASPSTYIIIAFNGRWDVTVNTPVIDNIPGFQTFDISLAAVRAALGNTVNDIYFHAGDGFPSGVTLKIDEIKFIRPNGLGEPSGVTDNITTNLDDKITVYPNPAINEIKLVFQEPLSKPTPLQIIDRLGKVVTNIMLDTGALNKVINTQGFAPGIYIFHINTPQGLIKKKVVIIP